MLDVLLPAVSGIAGRPFYSTVRKDAVLRRRLCAAGGACPALTILPAAFSIWYSAATSSPLVPPTYRAVFPHTTTPFRHYAFGSSCYSASARYACAEQRSAAPSSGKEAGVRRVSS